MFGCLIDEDTQSSLFLMFNAEGNNAVDFRFARRTARQTLVPRC